MVAVLGYSRRSDAELHEICVARLDRGHELAEGARGVILSGFPEAELMQAAWAGPEVVEALMRAALHGSGIRVHVEGADAPRSLHLLAREAACLVLLPFQLVRAIR